MNNDEDLMHFFVPASLDQDRGVDDNDLLASLEQLVGLVHRQPPDLRPDQAFELGQIFRVPENF